MIQRYFIALSNESEEPYDMSTNASIKIIILKDVHPHPDTIKEIFKDNPMFSFAFLFKGIFSEFTKDSFEIAEKQLIRKYKCSSFGLSERVCRNNPDLKF